MKILVLVKQVPDTWGDRHLDPTTGRVDRGASESIIDDVGERALETALRIKDDLGAEVIIGTVGPEGAKDALRKGLSMGADSAVHVTDSAIAGADLARTARVLAALARWADADLIITGKESTDGRGGAIPAMLAEHRGVAQLTQLNQVELRGSLLRGLRSTEYGTLDAVAELPAVASVTERALEARFPNFIGIMKAKKKALVVLSLEDLGESGSVADFSSVGSVVARPPRTAGVKIVDDGTAGSALVDNLATSRIL